MSKKSIEELEAAYKHQQEITKKYKQDLDRRKAQIRREAQQAIERELVSIAKQYCRQRDITLSQFVDDFRKKIDSVPLTGGASTTSGNYGG